MVRNENNGGRKVAFGAVLLLGACLAFFCTIRSFFLIALVAAVAVAAVEADGAVHTLVMGLVGFALCQIGYGLGIGLRASLSTRREPAEAPPERADLPQNVGRRPR